MNGFQTAAKVADGGALSVDEAAHAQNLRALQSSIDAGGASVIAKSLAARPVDSVPQPFATSGKFKGGYDAPVRLPDVGFGIGCAVLIVTLLALAWRWLGRPATTAASVTVPPSTRRTAPVALDTQPADTVPAHSEPHDTLPAVPMRLVRGGRGAEEWRATADALRSDLAARRRQAGRADLGLLLRLVMLMCLGVVWCGGGMAFIAVTGITDLIPTWQKAALLAVFVSSYVLAALSLLVSMRRAELRRDDLERRMGGAWVVAMARKVRS